ncbi:MAG TPA: hypothetical protein VGN12_20720 [Pirellulales bacterium]|jgi:hypothetical protein
MTGAASAGLSISEKMETLNQYHHVNGQLSNGASAGKTPNAETTTRTEKKDRPAHSLTNGRILTRIWAEQNDWGSITWRVDQYRMPVPNYAGGKFRSFHICDLQDAMRGLYEAKRWIKRADRQSTRRWFRW